MRYEIIALRASCLDIVRANEIVGQRTGDFTPLFCPSDATQDQPFDGHVHVFVMDGVQEIDKTLIDMDQMSRD